MGRLKKWLTIVLILAVIAVGIKPLSCLLLRHYMSFHQSRVQNLVCNLNKEHFLADTTGKIEHYQKAQEYQQQLAQCYQNKLISNFLNQMARLKWIEDPYLKRQLELVRLDFQGNQGDSGLIRNIIARQTAIERIFTVFRPQWQGKQVNKEELEYLLLTNHEEEELLNAWLAGCQVGSKVGPQLIELVKLRNQLAREQGYRDYFAWQMALNEQNEAELDLIFQRVDGETRDEYRRMKRTMDQTLARRSGIKVEELRPWHYQQIFLQQVPDACAANLDNYYGKHDIVQVVSRYFNDLGFSANQIINSSDLKPRAMKYPYAYCMDVDRAGDVRIVANLQNDADSAQTLLHEMGHAVFNLSIDPNLPWRLREPASIAMTEAIAMMFGDQYTRPDWLRNYLGLSAEEAEQLAKECVRSQQLNDLIFCRWSLVMYHFEKKLYAQPDSDLDQYWWDLIKKYQLMEPPAQPPAYAWAAKVHLATAPVYYYQYMLGRIMANQLASGWEMALAQPLNDTSRSLSSYLMENIFRPGASQYWQDLLINATGQPLDSTAINRRLY